LISIWRDSLERSEAFFKARRMHKSATRRYARYRTELPVIVKLLGKDGYVRIHGRCFEIAEAGLGAVITSELAAGEMITLEFSIPDISELFVIRAVVRHRMGFLHGFEFIGALPQQSQHIQTFCQTLEPS
jgi:PilZ domain